MASETLSEEAQKGLGHAPAGAEVPGENSTMLLDISDFPIPLF